MSRGPRPPEGITAFCRGMHPRLVGALALHCGDRRLAEELAQEALARAWERWPSVSQMGSPEGWTFRVAFNLAASRFRRMAAERRANRRLGVRSATAVEPDRADVLAVRDAVAGLPDRQRAAIVLRYFADLDVDQTAAALGCRPGTVKSLTSRAVDALRQRLGVSLDTMEQEDHEHV